ncbi:phage baseplate protein [Cupriavidus sp. D384]|uniref:phage baseplate protein n=1 Tax=Cupriavidus sp. D384 TaxID=1538095 RepID=UPI000836B7F6|nr:hypothetical protein [Cupriavidus sp. D384]
MSDVSLVVSGMGGRSTVGAITLDALLSETTELSSQTTAYAVEEGAPVSDHIRPENERLSLSGWVTASTTTLYSGASGRSKLVAAKDALRAIHRDRLPVVVVTGLDTYTDMVMESCKISRDTQGDFFDIACELRKIRKVKLRSVDIPPEKVAAANSKARGKAGGTKTNAGKVAPAVPTEKQASDLRRLLGRS